VRNDHLLILKVVVAVAETIDVVIDACVVVVLGYLVDNLLFLLFWFLWLLFLFGQTVKW
jgi:hypothetical protein